ncbi:MAG: T9SS type A sorting domain-containing protein [Candidatus Latescibacterota bacterium]|nr:MAG: T9SS type A sorting domain-containing protein [Candidatus Latescibacterota bacterium]
MRTAVSGLVAVMAICLFAAAPAIGQTPSDGKITVYFDEALTQRAMDCPGPGMLDTLYVVAEDWNTFLVGAQFKINYPPSMIWLSDLGVPPTTIGNSPNGISLGFAIPQNGFFKLELMQVLVLWNCTDCSAVNQLVTVVDHPLFDGVNGVQFPTFELWAGAGRSSGVCPDADLDIKPGSCPNPFNAHLFEWAEEGAQPKKGGVLPVAVLGSDTFDASMIDVESIRLEGVAPLPVGGGPRVRDVAGPVMDGDECACTEDGPDGYDDLMMKFRSQEIAGMIGSGTYGDVALTLTGTYLDGIPFEATDCVMIVATNYMPMGYQTVSKPTLKNVYPNPFNPTARITLLLPEASDVHLAVYDVAGHLVKTLENGHREAGDLVFEFDASQLASGVYFARMTAGNTTQVQRMVLLK